MLSQLEVTYKHWPRYANWGILVFVERSYNCDDSYISLHYRNSYFYMQKCCYRFNLFLEGGTCPQTPLASACKVVISPPWLKSPASVLYMWLQCYVCEHKRISYVVPDPKMEMTRMIKWRRRSNPETQEMHYRGSSMHIQSLLRVNLTVWRLWTFKALVFVMPVCIYIKFRPNVFRGLTDWTHWLVDWAGNRLSRHYPFLSGLETPLSSYSCWCGSSLQVIKASCALTN